MEFFHKRSMLLLRLSLGIVFLWFGVLKLFAVSPSLIILQNSLPTALGQSQFLSFLVSFIEILLGASFLSNKLDRIASIVAAISLLLITILVLITQGFDPRFPVLSAAGESVLKNLVLIAGCFALLSERNNKITDTSSKK